MYNLILSDICYRNDLEINTMEFWNNAEHREWFAREYERHKTIEYCFLMMKIMSGKIEIRKDENGQWKYTDVDEIKEEWLKDAYAFFDGIKEQWNKS